MGQKKRGIFLVFFAVSLLFFLISAFSVSAGYCANPAASSYCSGRSVSSTDCCPSSSDDYGEDGTPTNQIDCKNNFYSSSNKSVGGLCTTIGCCYIATEQTCDDSSLYGECRFDEGKFDSEGCDGSTVGAYCTEGCCIYYEGSSDAPTSVVSSAGFCDTSVDGDFTEGVTDTTDPSCSELAASYVEAAIECDDDVDNDGDGYTDYPLDAGCSSATDSSEQDVSKACDDGADNDGDGSVDTADTGCCEDPDTSNEQLCELDTCGSGEITTACNCYDTAEGITEAEGTYCEAGNSCIAGVCSAATAECSSGEREYCGISENDCLEYRYCEESVWGDCQETEACGKEPEICTDGTDQDGDGLVDCDDIDCYETKCGDSSGYSACGEKGYTEDSSTYLCCSTSNVNDCDGDGFSDTCGSCECITYLPHIAPEIDAVEFTLGKPQLTVSWTLACQVTFDLRRCTGDDCLTDITDLTDSEIEEAFPEIPGPNIEDAWEYTDATIGVNERYCYVVQAVYPDGSSAYSQPFCVDDSGDYWCQKMSTSEFCLDSYEGMSEELVYRVGCTGENQLSYLMDGRSCRAEYGANYLCIGPYDDGTTSCEYQSNCATCGDPLGLYAVLDFSELQNDDDDYYGVLCSEIPTCYFDYTRTTTNAFQECAQVSSCYDYASKSACEEQTHTTDTETTYTNKCLQRDCVWVDLSSGDIPSGICKEKSDDYARCDACNDAVHNGIFDACSQERCQEFGVDDADCYLSGLTNLCTDIADFTCSAYDDSTSCRDSHNVGIDADTNEITQESEDTLGLGVCYWDGEECYKDANGDEEADFGQEDMTPPVTTILTPNKMRALNITVLATDFNEDGSLGDGIKATYYCLSDDGSFCRPEDAVSLDSQGVGTIELGDGSGTYSLYYYSEDHAENLEVVQEYSFEVDKKGPVITIDYYVGVDTSEPYDASSLTFEISLDEEAYCTDYFETGESQIDNEFNDHFVVKYTDISDGGYLYNVTCTDSLGNNGEAFVLAYVDADSAIFDSSPYYYSDSNSVMLSVKTVQDADCGFSEGKEETSFVAMDEGFEKEQGAAYYLHSREWTLTENGVYYFDVKCELADGAVSDDEIEFIYDDTAPTTAVVDSFGDAFGFASFYTGENLDMYLACSDEPFFGFGCDVTYYCIDTSTCTPTTAYDPTDAIPYTLDVSKAYLCYFSIEKTFAGMGGLQETPSCTEIKIDSYTPTLTITSPSDGAVVYVPEVTVAGSVDDPDATEGTAINTVTITVKDTEDNETTYSGIDASHNFTYTLPLTLENNKTTYNYITLTGTDRSGTNTESETVRVLYTKELGEDAIWIVEPDNGVSDTTEFDFTIGTLLEAEKCGYSKNNAALSKSIALKAVSSDEEGEYLYSALYSIDASFDGIPEYVYVKCLLENGEEYSAKFTLEYDTTKPVIEDIEILNSDGKTPPSIVEEPLDPEIQVTTDDRTKCKYSFDADDTFNTGMTKFDDYDTATYNTTNTVVIEGLDDLKSYTVYIACQNGAYMTSATKSLSFSMNTSAASGMYLLAPEASGSRTFTITLGTTRSATGCDYGTSEDALSTTLTQIDDKGKEWETESITVTSDGNYTYYFGCWFVDGYFSDYLTLPVDTTAPIVDYVEDGNVSFSNTTLSATWSASDSLTEIVGYMYAIGSRSGYNDTYPWTNTTEKETIVEGLELDNQSTYYWSVKAINEVDLTSSSKSSDGVFIEASGSGESWALKAEKVSDVDYHPCSNGELDEGESDIDCGEDCDSCEAGMSCIVAEDCSSLNCDSGICQEATCDDGIINQGESDSDCGGNYCDGCGEGYACVYHRDCDSGYCEGKTCTAASCDDGVENGDETGIDCGGNCAKTCETVDLQPSPPQDKTDVEKGLPWWLWTIIVLLVAGAALGGYYGYIWYMKKKGKLPPGFAAFGGLVKKLPQLPPLGKLPGFGKLPQKFQMPSMRQIAQQKALQQKQQLREKYFTAFEEKPKEAKVSEKLPERPTKTPEKEKKTAPEKLGEKLVAKKPVKKEPSKAFTELEKLIKEKKK